MLKVVEGSDFDVAKRTTAATKLADGDELLFVENLQADATLVMHSEKDFLLRIDASQIPQKKKGAVGVRGMRLGDGDGLKGIHLLAGTENVSLEVKGKEVVLNRLHIGNRDTKGTKK